MTWDLELYYQIDMDEPLTEDWLVTTARQRLELAEAFQLESGDKESTNLMSDSHLLLLAAEQMRKGETIRNTTEESLARAAEHADTLEWAVSLADKRSGEIREGTVYELALGLRGTLKRLAENAASSPPA